LVPIKLQVPIAADCRPIKQSVMRRGKRLSASGARTRWVGQSDSSIRALLRYPREVLLVVGLTAGGTAAFYPYTTYIQKFLRLSVGLTDDQTTSVTAASLIFASCLQPLYDAISDRIGRKWLLIGFGVTGVLFTIPILTSLQEARGPFAAFLLIAGAWMIVSGYTSINAVVKAELFPTGIRATGVGVPYALTVSIFGGSADSVAAVVQVARTRDLVLVLPHRHDRDIANGLRVHARHQKGLGDEPSRVARHSLPTSYLPSSVRIGRTRSRSRTNEPARATTSDQTCR
jgi:hypothetical protein